MKKITTTFALAAILAGCAATGTQVSQDSAMQFKEGVSTESQIIGKLGRPTTTTISNGMKFMVYHGMQYQVKGATFIPIVGAFAGGSDYTMSTAVYQIGPDGVLQKITYSTSASGTRAGAAPAEMAKTEPTAIN